MVLRVLVASNFFFFFPSLFCLLIYPEQPIQGLVERESVHYLLDE